MPTDSLVHTGRMKLPLSCWSVQQGQLHTASANQPCANRLQISPAPSKTHFRRLVLSFQGVQGIETGCWVKQGVKGKFLEFSLRPPLPSSPLRKQNLPRSRGLLIGLLDVTVARLAESVQRIPDGLQSLFVFAALFS